MTLTLADICNIALQALQYEILDGGEMFLGVDKFLFLVDEGVHVVDEEDKQHLTMILSLQGLQVQHREDVLVNVLFLVWLIVVVYEVVLEISLYELDRVFVLWLENPIGEHFEDYL